MVVIHRERHFYKRGKYLKSWVYGGLDGVVTTFAVVAGVVGANLSSAIILIMGFANLIADGISMAIGDYLSTRSEGEYYKTEKDIEEIEAKKKTNGENKGMEKVLLEKGFKKNDAKKISFLISKNRNYQVETMVKEELGITHENANPRKNAVFTFMSFLLFGMIPLLLFVIGMILNSEIPNAFLFACILSGVSMFSLGVLKSKVTKKNWFSSGLQTLLIGGIAATAAYFVGEILSRMV